MTLHRVRMDNCLRGKFRNGQGDRNVECHTGIGIPRGGLAEVGGKYRKQGETELLDH